MASRRDPQRPVFRACCVGRLIAGERAPRFTSPGHIDEMIFFTVSIEVPITTTPKPELALDCKTDSDQQ
jgi:hypothetical protein